MSEQIQSKRIIVGGLYNWSASTSKEERIKNPEYERHNWCDIDVLEQKRFDSVLEVYRKYQVNVVSQRLGRGWHFMGDLVPYELWRKIWFEIKPYADPRWAPHTIRVTKKREDEIFEKPIYHNHGSLPPNWAKALMSFLCKSVYAEDYSKIYSAMHHSGLHKYFQNIVYPVVKRVDI